MNNGFKSYHPAVNLIFFLSVMAFGMLFKHPFSLFVCFVSSLVYYVLLLKKSALKSFFCFLLPTLVFVVAINGIFAHYGVTPVLSLSSGNKITLESLVYGFVLAVSTVTVIMWFFCYNEIVTTDKFMSVFGKILPTPALIVSMALRFVPMYKERLSEITQAQKQIGNDNTKGNFIERIRKTGTILSNLVTVSLEGSIETSDSMKARGYGLKGRKTYKLFKWKIKDTVFSLLIVVLDIIMSAGYVTKAVQCTYNPKIEINPTQNTTLFFIDKLNITVNRFSTFEIIILAAFTCLCFLPLFAELWEDIKWNRSKLKI